MATNIVQKKYGEEEALAAEPAAAPASKAPKVLAFYGHKPGKAFGAFSNFYEHRAPYTFRLPECVRSEDLPTEVECLFSEKAIMVCKAALFRDAEIFAEIVAADTPHQVKKLGRGVRGFTDERWFEVLETVAYEVVLQKMRADRTAREELLRTGDCLIAEAAPGDCIWGIGLPSSDPRVHDPSQWLGRNVLGSALMKVREALRAEFEVPRASAKGGKIRWNKREQQRDA